MAIYIKHGTNSILRIGSQIAAAQKCCCNQANLTITGSGGDPVLSGTLVSYTAHLSPLTPGETPTGSVTWKLNGSKLTTFPNPTPMQSNGTSSTPNLGTGGPGTLTYEADYSGDSNYAAKTATFVQHVQAFPANFTFSGLPIFNGQMEARLSTTYNCTLRDATGGGYTGNVTTTDNGTGFGGVYPPGGGSPICTGALQGMDKTLFMSGGIVNFPMVISGCATPDYSFGGFANGGFSLYIVGSNINGLSRQGVTLI